MISSICSFAILRGAYRGRQEYEDEYDNRPRPYNPPKKPIKYRNESSDESDHGERNEENFSHLKAGNFADITNDSFYLQNQKDSQQQSPRNVRIVARSRPSNASRPTNSTASNGGFVPRTSVGNSGEWRPKSIRIEGNAPQQPRGYADRNNDSNQPPSRSMDRNNNGWGKPQRYEDTNENQDFEEIDETDYATNNLSNARTAWNDARSSSEFNGLKDNYSTNMRRSNENDIRGNSNERPRQISANNNRASKNYGEEQYSDRRQRNEQMIAQDDSIEELELSDHFGKSKQNNNGRYSRNDDPPVSQRNSQSNDYNKGSQLAFVNKSHQSSTYQEGSFHTFARSQEAAGITLPRKSGRYDEGPIEDNDDAEGSTPHDHDNHNQQEFLENGNEDGDDIEEIPYGNDNETNNNASGRKKKQLVHKGNWTENPQLQQKSTNSSIYNYNGVNSFVLVAHPRGTRTPMVQCTIVRDRNSMHGKLYPTYELILEEPKKSLIIARKMSMNRTSNYHLFDMTRGQAGHTLSKKSGNYLGKLRSKNATRLGYTLLSSKSDREEVATILFEKVTLLDQIQDGNQPRRVKILLPRVDSSSLPVSVSAATYGAESLMDVLQAIDDHKRQIPADLLLLQTKDPVFENGNYRLNFHGRVSLPSVKNFQIVSHDDIHDVKCQFGKVDKDVFHLDFKAPFTAFEAFAVALCQFNL
jgi:hypothetical protein